MICPYCGNNESDQNVFCSNCGNPLPHANTTEASTVAAASATTASTAAVPSSAQSNASRNKQLIILAAVAAAAVLALVLAVVGTQGNSGGGSVGGSNFASSNSPLAGETTNNPLAASSATTPTPDASTTDKGQQASSSGENATANNATAANTTPQSIGSTVTPIAIAPDGTTVQALARPTLITSTVTLERAAQAAPATVLTPAAPNNYAIEPGLANVINTDQFYGLDTTLLEKNAFYVQETRNAVYSAEYFDLYEMNRYSYIPSFVTTDSLMHTYHLYFMHVLKNVESTYLQSLLGKVSTNLMNETASQLEQVKGTSWEEAAKRNLAFFAVGATLLNPNTDVPASVTDIVADECTKIMDASSQSICAITATLEDYTQYKPRGYYTDSEQLESYFRAMMWYGRINFTQKDETLDKCAALMTLALNSDAGTGWDAIYAVTSFFAGASDDCGYYEYEPIATTAWGSQATAADLANNDDGWQKFHAITANMPAPKINSVVVIDEGTDVDHEEEEKGFRFMGQRFTLDAAIFQNLVYNKVGENASGQKRDLPNALDVPAAFGSDEALVILEAAGETSYAKYSENMQYMRDAVQTAPSEIWNASLYGQWLATLTPLLEEHGEGYPLFMQSKLWTRKNLQSFLGSYTELKHDTVLYAKQVMVEMGGGGIEERDDRGYVEPEPELFRRLANLAQATADGLDTYSILTDGDRENLKLINELATRLATIADKELAGEVPNDDDFELIRSYGGQLEHFWEEVYRDQAPSEYFKSRDFPAALVVDVATNLSTMQFLELGTGSPAEIYVVVPVDGTLRVARGTVFSFYQFASPTRLNDTEWRESMGLEMKEGSQTVDTAAHTIEDWTTDFMKPVSR